MEPGLMDLVSSEPALEKEVEQEQEMEPDGKYICTGACVNDRGGQIAERVPESTIEIRIQLSSAMQQDLIINADHIVVRCHLG